MADKISNGKFSTKIKIILEEKENTKNQYYTYIRKI